MWSSLLCHSSLELVVSWTQAVFGCPLSLYNPPSYSSSMTKTSLSVFPLDHISTFPSIKENLYYFLSRVDMESKFFCKLGTYSTSLSRAWSTSLSRASLLATLASSCMQSSHTMSNFMLSFLAHSLYEWVPRASETIESSHN